MFGGKVGVALICALFATAANATDLITDWAAGGGLPTATSPAAYVHYGTTDGTIANDIMTLSTRNYYGQDNNVVPGFDTVHGLSIEARVRYVSGSTSDDSRDTISIFFTQDGNYGNALFIGNGRMFINTANLSRGGTAFVDTSSAFHTYRIDLGAQDAITNLASIAVYYDGVQTLTGSTFYSTQANGPDLSFAFGEGSALASGTSEWSFVRNTAAVPEPMSWAMMVVGFGLAGGALRRRRGAALA